MKFLKKNTTGGKLLKATLPGIIFMLLFFLLVPAVMPVTGMKVGYDISELQQLVKLDRSDPVIHIHIKKPKPTTLGRVPVIQADGSNVKLEDIGDLIEKVRANMDEAERGKLSVSFKIDEEIQMGMVLDILSELRKANVRKVNYESLNKS